MNRPIDETRCVGYRCNVNGVRVSLGRAFKDDRSRLDHEPEPSAPASVNRPSRAFNQPAAADDPSRRHGAARKRTRTTMMTRSTTSAVTGRASSMRRMRRRTHFASAGVAGETRAFCRTNGCASFLEVDPTTGRGLCPICGYTPRAN